MRIKIGLLNYNTQEHQSDALAARMARIAQGMWDLERELSPHVLPGSQPLRGVLLAPEYMFARPAAGQDHAFGEQRQLEQADADGVRRAMEALSARYPGILLVPGTVAWRKPVPQDLENGWARKIPKYTAILEDASRYNSHYGTSGSWDPMDWEAFPPADARPGSGGYVVTARDKVLALTQPGAYVARNTAFCFLNGRCIFKYHKIGDYHEVLHWGANGLDTVNLPSRYPGRFKAGGLEFGLSICYDQSLSQMDLVQGRGFIPQRMQKTADPVDVHILLSAWIPPHVSQVNLKRDGLLLSCSSNPACNVIYSGDVDLALMPDSADNAMDIYDLPVPGPRPWRALPPEQVGKSRWLPNWR